jgi:hypothetical protein
VQDENGPAIRFSSFAKLASEKTNFLRDETAYAARVSHQRALFRGRAIDEVPSEKQG